jgi:predicted MPP superfamily phosphohydrolase
VIDVSSAVPPTTIFHCSDLHFGHPAVPEQYEAMEALIAERAYTVVAISGDVSQRARSGEFQRARAFIKHAEAYSRVICIPGNHDVQWWKAPFGLGDESAMFATYRRFIDEDIEPIVHVAGATFAGLNTSHGVTGGSLTWRMREIR